MRKTLLVGLVLVVAAVVVVFLSDLTGLELEPVILLGLTLGAVLALVPDRSAAMRLVGFAGGFVAAWIGYLLRAAVLPDSAGGRAVVIALVLAIVVGIAAVSMGRIPLWSGLLGAGAFAGAFEYTYSAAPPEVAWTSVTAATALLLTTAAGFLAAAFVAPAGEQPSPRGARANRPAPADDATPLDDMMEKSK